MTKLSKKMIAKIDEYGRLAAQAKEIEEKMKAIKPELLAATEGWSKEEKAGIKGTEYQITISQYVEQRISIELVKGKLTPQQIFDCTVPNPITKILSKAYRAALVPV